jgi:predicted DNA-binding helix-hairpin-helix protein
MSNNSEYVDTNTLDSTLINNKKRIMREKKSYQTRWIQTFYEIQVYVIF